MTSLCGKKVEQVRADKGKGHFKSDFAGYFLKIAQFDPKPSFGVS